MLVPISGGVLQLIIHGPSQLTTDRLNCRIEEITLEPKLDKMNLPQELPKAFWKYKKYGHYTASI